MTTPLPGQYSPSICSQARSEFLSRTPSNLDLTSARHNSPPRLDRPLGIFQTDFWNSSPYLALSPGQTIEATSSESPSMLPTPTTTSEPRVRFDLPSSASTTNLRLPLLRSSPLAPSSSTPDFRLEVQHESSTDRLKNRFTSFFRRKPRKSSPARTSNNTYTYDTQQGLQESRSRTTLPPDYEPERRYGLVMSNRDSQQEELSGVTEATRSLHFEEYEQDEYTDVSSETYVDQQVEEVRSSTEPDASQPKKSTDDSGFQGQQLRKYKDLSDGFHAARAANPIYDGNTINTADAVKSPQYASKPLGKWCCCKCGGACELYEDDEGDNLVDAVTCACPHRSCENCTLTGRLKPYKPVQEPIPVQLPDDKPKQVQFGVFCGNCGLSWRAQTVKDTVRQKVSAVPKTLAKAGGQPLEKLRQSKSLVNLLGEPNSKPATGLSKMKSNANLRAKSDEMEKEHGKQVKSVMVYFSGFDCTCGHTLDASALCFQIVEADECAAVVAAPSPPPENAQPEPSFTASPEDRIRGIGNSVLKIRRGGKTIYHPNPLASNPVSEEDLKWLNSLS